MARKKGKKGGQKPLDNKKEEEEKKAEPQREQADTKKETKQEEKPEKQETKPPQQGAVQSQSTTVTGAFPDISESSWKVQSSKKKTIEQQRPSPQAAAPPQPIPATSAQSGLPAWMQKKDEVGLPQNGRGRGRGRGIGRGKTEPVGQAVSVSPGAAQTASIRGRISPVTSPWGKQVQPIARSPSPQQLSPATSSPPSSSPLTKATSTEQTSVASPLESTGAVPKVLQQKSERPIKGPRRSPTGSIDKLSEKVERFHLLAPPRKVGYTGGTKGRSTMVETNHLALTLSRTSDGKFSTIYQYDVTVEPDTPKRLLRNAVRDVCQEHFPGVNPAYDGRKILYCSKRIHDDITDTVKVCDSDSDKPREFKVTIKFAAPINMTALFQYMQGQDRLIPHNAVQAVDIILRQAPAFRFLPVGRSFFSPPAGRVIDLGDGCEMWYGFYQSAVLGWKPFLNIDVAHKSFPKKQPVINLIFELCSSPRDRQSQTAESFLRNMKGLSLNFVDRVNKFLKGLKISYSLPNTPGRKRVYRVNRVMSENSSNLYFKDGTGKQFSIEKYFETEKGIRLRFPHLPCLHVGSQQRTNPIYLPVEFCEVEPGQSTNRKMTEQQTSGMIKHAATSAPDRKQKIIDAINNLKYNNNPCVREFGLSVLEKFEKVKARVLEPPKLEYDRSPSGVTPQKGVWRCGKFFSAKNLDRWAIVNLDERIREDQLRKFAELLVTTGRNLNMSISVQEASKTISGKGDKNLAQFESYLTMQKQNGITFFIVVIPDRVPGIYASVKQVAELRVGVLTQCIKSVTMERRINQSTVQNILLKVNSKMDGINHTLAKGYKPKVLEEPVMFVGADVTHPSPDQKDIPSVVAVCASHDASALYKYNMECRLQPPRTEMIQDLEDIMATQLLFFKKATNQIPRKIFYFRDGVSEGEFATVLNVEMMAIRRACQRMNSEYKPRITFLVVQKRHHTRFFPIYSQDEDGKNRNVPPGTVVDTEITHPTELDFYLVSHASIQGVSRPTKYRRLWDDNDMTEDELEELTYYLCHMFSRCTRAVSYPTPTYYAHLAAYRARTYIEGKKINLLDLPRAQKEHAAILDDVKSKYPMFFV